MLASCYQWNNYNGIYIIECTSAPRCYVYQLGGGSQVQGKLPEITYDGSILTVDWINVFEGYPGGLGAQYTNLSNTTVYK